MHEYLRHGHDVLSTTKRATRAVESTAERRERLVHDAVHTTVLDRCVVMVHHRQLTLVERRHLLGSCLECFQIR